MNHKPSATADKSAAGNRPNTGPPHLPLQSVDYRSILENYIDECFMIVDPALIIQHCSLNFKRQYFQYFMREIREGDSILAYVPDGRVEIVRDFYQRALAGEHLEIETTLPGKHLMHSYLNKYRPLYDSSQNIVGIFVTSFNLTATRRAQQDVRNNEVRYQHIVENTHDAFFSGTADGRILEANQAALSLFGYSLEEFLQLNRTDIIDHHDSRFMEHLAERQKTGKMKGEARGIRKNGEYFYFEFSSVAYTDLSQHQQIYTFINDISARKNTEKAIELSEKRFRALIENNSDIILMTDDTGVVQYSSPSFERVTGWSFTEVSSDRDLLLSNLHPGYAQHIRQTFLQAIKTPGIPIAREFQFRHKQGHYIWLEGFITNFLYDANVNALVSNYKDISGHQQAAEQIKASENNLKTIFENTSEAFLLMDNQRMVKAFNNNARKIGLLNNDSDIQIGKDVLMFIDDSRHLVVMAMFERAFKGETIQYDRHYQLDNGEPRWIEFAINPVYEDGQISGCCVTGRDITARKTAEETLRKRELRFRSILENSHDLLLLFDSKGHIEFHSPAVEKMFGYINHGDDIQHILHRIHPEDLRKVVKKHLEAYNNPGLPVSVTFRKRKKDGVYTWLEGTLTNMLHNHEVRVMVANFSNVTERKNFEEQQALLVSIVNSSEDAILSLNLSNTILTWNKGAERMFGFSAAEAIGQNYRMMIPPDRWHEETDIIERLQNKQSVKHYETQRLKKNGELLDISLTVSPVKDRRGHITGASKIARDISDRKKAEEIIRNNEKRFRSLLQNSSDGLTLLSIDGTTLDVSPTGRRILGLEENEMIGFIRHDLVHPEDLGHVTQAFIDVITEPSKTSYFEYRLLTTDGSYKWLEASCQNMLNEPAVGAIVVNYRDITDRKNQEFEQEKLIKTLNQNNSDLRNFSYITSHNLKAPLSNLMGFIELLQDIPVEDPTLRTILQGFSVSTIQLNNTVNDLVKILIIRDSDAIEQKEIAFDTIFNQVKDLLATQLQEVKPRIITDFSKASFVIFNETYLESILMNLLSNAIKYRAYERPLRITVKTRIENNNTILTFADNGIGFDTIRHKEKIFGLYQRFHNRPNSKGLGLYLIKSQMESLQGSISVKSTVGKGTTFTLRFQR